MKAVMIDVPEKLLAERRRTGADQWDEMWGGVLHMTPAPNVDHQDLEAGIEFWLRQHWAKPRGNRVYHQINVSTTGCWPNDFRIPDLVLLTPAQFSIDQRTHFEGPPLVVVEIHSPDDESYEKLAFYADLGVPEAWIIHRDSRKPELYRLRRREYDLIPANDAGWIVSEATGIWLRPRRPKKLWLQLGADETTAEAVPS